MKRYTSKMITAILVLTLLLSNAAVILPLGGVAPVEAAPGAPNLIIGLFRFMAALEQRNRVYGEARVTAAELNAYYDQLTERNNQMRAEMVRKAIAGEIHPRFARSYIRLGAALRSERNAAMAMIEAEKQQARQEFLRRLGREIRGILIGSPSGQKVLTEIRETIGGIREAAVAVQVAAEAGKPTQMLGEALGRKVGGMSVVKDAARELGSMAGHQIDRGLGGLISRVEGVIDNINTEVDGVIDWLDDMDDAIARQQEQSREPVSMVGNRTIAAARIPVDREAAAVDIAANAYARAAEQGGHLEPGMTRDKMIDRIRAGLLDARLSGIEIVVSGTLSGQVFCTGVGRGEYEVAAKALGQVPQVSQTPEQAHYVVCYDLESGLPQSARLFGALTDEEREAIGQDQSEKPPTSPGSTRYVGTMDWSLLDERDSVFDGQYWNPDQYQKNIILIEVADDGTVSGEYELINTFVGTDNYCTVTMTYHFSGVFSGQIVDTEGTITVSETISSDVSNVIVHDERCRQDDDSLVFGPFSREVEFQIFSDQMTGIIIPMDTGDPNYLRWSFLADRQ